MKKYPQNLGVLFFLLALGYPFIVHAVSYSPVPTQQEEKAVKGIRLKGESVCLFHSGTGDVKKAIRADDILVVFREGPQHEFIQVGKIKVLLYLGEDYIKGEVVDGEVRTGDIAKKGDVASLVISSEGKCK